MKNTTAKISRAFSGVADWSVNGNNNVATSLSINTFKYIGNPTLGRKIMLALLLEKLMVRNKNFPLKMAIIKGIPSKILKPKDSNTYYFNRI